MMRLYHPNPQLPSCFIASFSSSFHCAACNFTATSQDNSAPLTAGKHAQIRHNSLSARNAVFTLTDIKTTDCAYRLKHLVCLSFVSVDQSCGIALRNRRKLTFLTSTNDFGAVKHFRVCYLLFCLFAKCCM